MKNPALEPIEGQCAGPSALDFAYFAYPGLRPGLVCVAPMAL